jgi:peroxiredoxin
MLKILRKEKMKKFTFLLATLLIIVFVFSGCAGNTTNSQNTQNQQSRTPAPDFSWSDGNGNTIHLTDLKGKVVLLDFWATWCGPCKMTIPHIEAIYEKYKDKNVVVLGVNLDTGDLEKVKSFIDQYGMKYLVITDPKSAVAGKYMVNSIPTFFIIDKEGNIAKTIIGYDPNIEDMISKEIDTLLKE